VKSLAIFGSVARGDASVGSDVDILVEFKGPATFDQYMKLKIFLEELLGCPVDLLTRKGIRPELAPSIEQEAVYVS
jgi:predicted nucleotidyltransferase